MIKSMLNVWEEAVSEYKSLSLHGKDYQAYMYKGIKIIKTNQDVRIYHGNLKASGYIEISPEEYEVFRTVSYRTATHNIIQDGYKRKIFNLNERIKEEVNTRNNKKHYEALRVKRTNLINKYSEISKTN